MRNNTAKGAGLSVRLAGKRLGIFLIVVSVSGALLVVESVAARRVLAASFSTLEYRQGERSLDQALKALEADLGQLAISTHDYAVWDDAFEFVETRDPRFVESNITAETLGNMRVDLVWMIDARGNEILSFQRPPGHESEPPVPADVAIVDAVRAKLPALIGAPETAALARLFQTKRGLLAVAACRIVPTRGIGAPRGTLVFGRFVDQKAVERAQTTSQLPLHVYLSASSTYSLPAQAQALWALARDEPDRELVPTSDTTLSGFVLLRDVNGGPAAIVATSIPRTLITFGKQTGRSMVIIFSAVIAVFAVIVGGLLLYLEKVGAASAASERRYRALITQAKETILLVDTLSRRILEANPAATKTLGFSADELVKMDIDELFYACDGDVLKPVWGELHAAASPDSILLIRSKSRDFIDVEMTAGPLVVDGRDVTSFVLRDVSARKRVERELVDNQDRLAHLAHHDMLTSLLNRLGLEQRMPEVIKAAAELGRSVAFLYIDLDHFKKINDLRGHACGDKLLRVAAERLRHCMSSGDLIVRMGGDEFVVVAAGLCDSASAAAIAGRLREALAVPFEVDDQHFKLTASIGVSVFPDDGGDYEILLKNADIALYESKEAGRDTFAVFNSEMTSRVSERLTMEFELRQAIQRGEFYLDYQPLVDPKTQRVASIEALIRWRHPVRGRVPPLQFISVAERTGLICEIGAFVIREVCKQIGEWQRGGAVPVPVAVNVSSKQLEQRDVVDLFENALASSKISPSLLRIEITESVFMDASDIRVQHLNELRRLGVQVSVDDFGTGYSSLAYLKHLPVDCLKIDRAFVRDIESGSADEVIVKAIIRMAQSLGLSTVAEGVETPEQARRLRDLGATYIQGFYFSPPLAADACRRLLVAHSGAISNTVPTPLAPPAGAVP